MLFTEKKGVFMNSTTLAGFVLLAQQGGSAYGAGQIAGAIFLVVFAGAILWRIFFRKS